MKGNTLSRDKFIDYVKNGQDKPIVSLQIGAGAGFDVKLAGKLWNSEGTIEDTIAAYEKVGGEPLYNIGLPGLDQMDPGLVKKVKKEDKPNEKLRQEFLDTPFGTLEWKFHEIPKTGTMFLKYPVTVDDDQGAFDKIKWYCEKHHKAADKIPGVLGPAIEKIQKHGAVSVQWNLQPFEMFGLAPVDSLVLLAKLYPDDFRQTCDFIRDANIDILNKVLDAGADFVFLGGPGSEMLSPDMYKDFLIPDSQVLSGEVHRRGRLIYSHICSPVEPFLTMGFYNEMGIDLFETLSPPPVGNVPDLAKAREILDDNICTRGNIGLDLLLNGTVEEVEKATIEVLEATKGTKHMVAASDYLFYDIPFENVKAVVETVQNYI